MAVSHYKHSVTPRRKTAKTTSTIRHREAKRKLSGRHNKHSYKKKSKTIPKLRFIVTGKNTPEQLECT